MTGKPVFAGICAGACMTNEGRNARAGLVLLLFTPP